MNFRVIFRLLQRLVPAEKRGCEPACPPLVNSPIPADSQAGSPEPVESQRDALEAALAHARAMVDRDVRCGNPRGVLNGEHEIKRLTALLETERKSGVEALVADLVAAMRLLDDLEAESWEQRSGASQKWSLIEAALRRTVISLRSGSATGGNDKGVATCATGTTAGESKS